uniref:AC transposase n=2 Tax=Cajanus cajan TaxID=3821 RepID=A0A151S1M6_CAJCA|nr:Putative AC transposase [Cajanus cajan]
MCCCTHILCLIVKDDLKEVDESILRICGVVKYIRSSPSRLARFKACVEQEKITYKGLVCLDVETRWNSTYLMLEAALKYKKTFDLLEMQDNKYVEDLHKGKGVPFESE